MSVASVLIENVAYYSAGSGHGIRPPHKPPTLEVALGIPVWVAFLVGMIRGFGAIRTVQVLLQERLKLRESQMPSQGRPSLRW